MILLKEVNMFWWSRRFLSKKVDWHSKRKGNFRPSLVWAVLQHACFIKCNKSNGEKNYESS
jgi:hypothetical protein